MIVRQKQSACYQEPRAERLIINRLHPAYACSPLHCSAKEADVEEFRLAREKALQGLIHAANIARAQGLAAVPDDIAAPLIHAFRHGVLLGLSQIPPVPGRKQEPCRDLLECLRDRQADVLRFAADLRVPPTSNQAERDARPAKTQQKISGRLRSEETTRHRYAIRGYISTAAKHGADVLTVLRDALTGQPWTPPIPALP